MKLHFCIFSLINVSLLAGALAQENSPTGYGCRIQDNNTGNTLAAGAHGDPLFKIVTSQDFCANNALEFRKLVLEVGLDLHPAMVANRGYNNPLPQGLFSFFEAVTGDYKGMQLGPGDWFFGHFQVAVNDAKSGTSQLQEQNQASDNALLLESVVWDPSVGYYRFYEIRGNGQGGEWFYRGSSVDVLKDIKNVWRNTNIEEPLFGKKPDLVNGHPGGARLRCSGCHMNGGPIMKELAAPHNMWWREKRPLPLGSMVVQPAIQTILDNVVDAGDFSSWVNAGYHKLFSSDRYMKARAETTLQEQLRVLFCEQEVNIAADTTPLGDPKETIVKAPIGFFIDPRLLPEGPAFINIPKKLYVNALHHFGSRIIDNQAGGLRPTDGIDADHGFSSPVKSHSDMLLSEAMIKRGLIDREFLLDILAVDMTRPMFSDARNRLLLLLPNNPDGNWIDTFKQNLKNSSDPAAAELLTNLTDPNRNSAYHYNNAKQLVEKLIDKANDQNAVTGWVRLVGQRRIEVFHAQISQHPQGQIFEPDFRLIFPTYQLIQQNQQEAAYGGVPGQYWLNPETAQVELSSKY
jgi:hypothetical protein